MKLFAIYIGGTHEKALIELHDMRFIIAENIKDTYELIDMSSIFTKVQYAPYLLMKNPSTGTMHMEGVHPDCKTVEQALNWRNQTDGQPIVLT